MKQFPSLLIAFFTLILLTLVSCETPQENESEKGFSISMNLASNPQTANPLYYSNSNEILICRHLFQPLLSINDSFNGYVPILAEKLPEKRLIDGKTVFHYKLKSQSEWDNGTSLSSEDIITSFKIVFNPHSELPYLVDYYSFIDSIVAINNLEFNIYSNSNAPNLYFRSGDFDVLPKYIFDEDGILDNYSIQDLKNYSPDVVTDSLLLKHGQEMVNLKILKSNSEISGTGPYSILEYNVNQNVTLAKKDNWWGQQFSDDSYLFKSNPDRVILKIYMDPLPAIMDFINSKLDVLSGLNQESLSEISKNKELMNDIQTETYIANAFVYLAINRIHPLFVDRQVRKAISILSDPETFIREFLDSKAIAISSPISKSNSSLNNSELKALKFDPEKATLLLKEAGWEQNEGTWYFQNEEVIIDFLVQSGNKNSEDYAIFFKNNASKIGLKINLIPLEFSAYISKVREGDFALSRLGTSTGPMFDNFRSLFHSSAIGRKNYPRINNPQIDALIEKIEVSENFESRKILIWKLQELVFNEFNYVFLYSPLANVYLDKNLGDFTLTPDATGPWPPAFTRKE